MGTQPERPDHADSRWIRPNLYITIVGIYLFLISGTNLFNALLRTYYWSFISIPNYNAATVASVYLASSHGLSVAFSVVSVVGAIWLLRKNRKGLKISLIVLIYWLVSFASADLILLPEYSGIPKQIAWLIGVTVLVSVFVLMLIGRKRVQWR